MLFDSTAKDISSMSEHKTVNVSINESDTHETHEQRYRHAQRGCLCRGNVDIYHGKRVDDEQTADANLQTAEGNS